MAEGNGLGTICTTATFGIENAWSWLITSVEPGEAKRILLPPVIAALRLTLAPGIPVGAITLDQRIFRA
jgi:hypothetical protein